jgi:predicted enzyme related to lactoylglutathione lyase
MGAAEPPTLANGKICYIEIPAIDVSRSAEFYRRSFGWQIRDRGKGSRINNCGSGYGEWSVGVMR